MKKLFKFIPIVLLLICFTIPFILKQPTGAEKVADLSTTLDHNSVSSTAIVKSEEPTIDNARQTVTPPKPAGVSQAQIIEKEVRTVELSENQLKDEIKTLKGQQLTLTAEGADFETDLKKNYLNKLIKIRDGIEKQKSSESHPQIRSNGLKAVNAMIDMMTAYISNPNDGTYKRLGEDASRHVQKAFANVDLSDTIEIVKYLTSAGPDQVSIGLKLRDAQTIATKFLENYGSDGTEKGEAYKKNKLQQVATQNVMEVKQLELDELTLHLSGLRQELEEITQ